VVHETAIMLFLVLNTKKSKILARLGL